VTHFGYENHVKVDAKSKLIIAHHTIAAHVHDSQTFRQLVDSIDQRVLADSAYTSAQHEAYLLECNVEEFLMRKGHRGKPLSAAENKSNHTISRIRVRVEHVFARMKHMGADYVRNIGLKRASQHNALSNLVYNMDLYVLLVK
jgi:transposase, IS5 family